MKPFADRIPFHHYFKIEVQGVSKPRFPYNWFSGMLLTSAGHCFTFDAGILQPLNRF